MDAFRLDEDKIDFFGACNTLNILIYTIRLEIKNSQELTLNILSFPFTWQKVEDKTEGEE